MALSPDQRVISFSIKLDDTTARKEINKLYEYCEKNHKVFSSMLIQAVKDFNIKLESQQDANH